MKIISEKRVAYFMTAAVLASSVLIVVNGAMNRQQEERLRNAQVDVLKDWSIKVDDSKVYKPGDVLVLESKFTKLLDRKGDAKRYFQCLKPGTNNWDGKIPASESDGTRPPVKNGTSVSYIGIPLNLGLLPNTCRIRIEVTYDVDQYHLDFLETTNSNSFRVEPRPGVIDAGGGQTIIYTTDPTTFQDTQSSIMPPTTPMPTPIIISQPTPISEPTPEEQPVTSQPAQPSLIERILDPITNLLSRIIP